MSFKGAAAACTLGGRLGWGCSRCPGSVNSKNRFGGYVGGKQYQVLIKNGRVIRYCMEYKVGLFLPVNNWSTNAFQSDGYFSHWKAITSHSQYIKNLSWLRKKISLH